MRNNTSDLAPVAATAHGRTKVVIGWAWIVCGLCLGGLALSGTATSGQAYFPDNVAVEPPDLDVAALRSLDAMVAFVQATSPVDAQETVRTIYDIVRRRFDRCTPFFRPNQNWILWGMGQIWPLRGAVTAPLLPRYSNCGLCDQVNGVFVLISTAFDIPARLVSMPGHTTAEAFWNGSWHVVDPHFDYFPDSSFPAATAETFGKHPQRARDAYAHLEKRTAAATVDSYIRFSAGEGTRREVGRLNAPRLVVIQQVAEIGKFAVPVLFVVVGVAVLRRGSDQKKIDPVSRAPLDS